MNTQTDISLLVEVARLYYEHDYSQQQISEKLNISRPMISRFLTQARERGIVRITVMDPTGYGTKLEHELQQHYQLKKAVVVPNEDLTENELKTHLGRAAAGYLDQIITDDTTLGLAWGTTMQALIRQLQPKRVRNMKVVQVIGGFTSGQFNTFANEIVQQFAQVYQAESLLLPLPAIVDNVHLKKAMLTDRNMARVLDMARDAQIVIFSIAPFTPTAPLVRAQYFQQKEVEDLLNCGAVGDICTHIINASGEICSQELENRNLGLPLEDIKKKPYSIVVAGGQEKLSIIRAGLNGRCFNVLVTDEWTARQLINEKLEAAA